MLISYYKFVNYRKCKIQKISKAAEIINTRDENVTDKNNKSLMSIKTPGLKHRALHVARATQSNGQKAKPRQCTKSDSRDRDSRISENNAKSRQAVKDPTS